MRNLGEKREKDESRQRQHMKLTTIQQTLATAMNNHNAMNREAITSVKRLKRTCQAKLLPKIKQS